MSPEAVERPAQTQGTALGVDVGARRVGMAGGDATGSIASPLRTLDRTHPKFWSRFEAACADRSAEVIVVGLPLQLDGGEGRAAAEARRFATAAGERLGITVELWDERFTTVAAERALISVGMRRRPRRTAIDSVAAAFMLQGWLDARRNRLGG